MFREEQNPAKFDAPSQGEGGCSTPVVMSVGGEPTGRAGARRSRRCSTHVSIHGGKTFSNVSPRTLFSKRLRPAPPLDKLRAGSCGRRPGGNLSVGEVSDTALWVAFFVRGNCIRSLSGYLFTGWSWKPFYFTLSLRKQEPGRFRSGFLTALTLPSPRGRGFLRLGRTSSMVLRGGSG